jgi:hypothetical protein
MLYSIIIEKARRDAKQKGKNSWAPKPGKSCKGENAGSFMELLFHKRGAKLRKKRKKPEN